MLDINNDTNSLSGTWNEWSKYILKELTRLDLNEKEIYTFINTLQTQIQKTITVLEGVVSQQNKLESRLDVFDKEVDKFKLSVTQKLSFGSIGGIMGAIIIKLLEFIMTMKSTP